MLPKTLKSGGDFTDVAGALAFIKTYNWADNLEIHVTGSFGADSDVNDIQLDNDPLGKTITWKTDPATPTVLGTIHGRWTVNVTALTKTTTWTMRQLKLGCTYPDGASTSFFIRYNASLSSAPAFQSKIIDCVVAIRSLEVNGTGQSFGMLTHGNSTAVKLGECVNNTFIIPSFNDAGAGFIVYLTQGLFHNNLFLFAYTEEGMGVFSNAINPHKNNTFYSFSPCFTTLDTPLNFTDAIVDVDPVLVNCLLGKDDSVATMLGYDVRPTALSAPLIDNADAVTADAVDIVGHSRV